ncbi:MAG TPA: ferric reductase-like transmembrane domain-containing protein [Candidatus Saccharimonadales bacterium]|nr:ferric reductase-like transmembrane domain-containing protein [Candidatus Saccharimonadales bacterium]
MTLRTKKTLAWGFWGINLAVVFGFWLSGPAPQQIASGDLVVAWHAVGRLFGLVATYCALVQFVLMGRVGWLEPIFGLDRLAVFHRGNGTVALLLMLLHSSSMVITFSLLSGVDPLTGAQFVLGLPFVMWAAVAEVLFVVTVVASVVIVRRHLKFETWYTVHLFNYLAIAFIPFHQLTNGSDFLLNQVFAWYWIGLYVFALLNLLIWRFGRTFWLSWRHDFTVEKVVKETPTAHSVYITGKNLQHFRAKGGQFVLVRFLDKERGWQEHPFSLSQLPDEQYIRLTVRQLGDFTNSVPAITPGTKVWVSGPFGAFTHEQQVANKVLYIAGGIGITPLRAMIQERAESGQKGTAAMLYGNRTIEDTALMGELEQLAQKIAMPIYNILSEQKDYKGEVGFVDKEKIARLVPDVAERDVFLCGPPPMMAGVKKALAELGVPANQVHYERFALHKG